jgi:hypothetical protein
VRKEGSIADLLERKDKTQITTDVLSDRTIEQIKRIIERDSGEFDVKAPMQGLESFFIDIVRQAQQEKMPTSGAVNRLELTQAQRTAAVAGILDRLVAAKVEPDRVAGQKKPVETVEIKPAEDVLSRLTVDERKDSKPPPQRDREQQTAEQEQRNIKKNLLNELVDGQNSTQKQKPDADDIKRSGDDENG